MLLSIYSFIIYSFIHSFIQDVVFSRSQRGGAVEASQDPVTTRHIRGIKSPYDRAALRTIGG